MAYIYTHLLGNIPWFCCLLVSPLHLIVHFGLLCLYTTIQRNQCTWEFALHGLSAIFYITRNLIGIFACTDVINSCMNDRSFYFVTWRPLFDHGLCYRGRRASLYIGRSSAHILVIINVFYCWVPEQNIICFLFLLILWMFPANVLEDQGFRVRLPGSVTIRRADCPIGRWCRRWPRCVSMVNVGMGRSPSGRGLDIRCRAPRTWWGCSDCLCGYCCLLRLRHLLHCPAIALAPPRRPGAVLRRGHDMRTWTRVAIVVECGGCVRGRRRRLPVVVWQCSRRICPNLYRQIWGCLRIVWWS